MAPARAIVNDIRRRILYSMVDEVLVPGSLRPYLTKDRVTPKTIAGFQTSEAMLTVADFLICWPSSLANRKRLGERRHR